MKTYISQALLTHPRPPSLIPDLSYNPGLYKSVPGPPPHPSQPIHTHLRPSHQRFQYPYQILQSHLKHFKPISGPPHPPEAHYIHLKHFTLISGPSHSSQALYTYLKPLSPISGPPHPPKVMHTHLRLSMPILGPLHSSLALYSHLRAHTPVPDPPATRRMVFHVYKYVHFTVCRICK